MPPTPTGRDWKVLVLLPSFGRCRRRGRSRYPQASVPGCRWPSAPGRFALDGGRPRLLRRSLTRSLSMPTGAGARTALFYRLQNVTPAEGAAVAAPTVQVFGAQATHVTTSHVDDAWRPRRTTWPCTVSLLRLKRRPWFGCSGGGLRSADPCRRVQRGRGSLLLSVKTPGVIGSD